MADKKISDKNNETVEITATVIILSYNQQDTIARAIESVLAQKCRHPFEILIADDGSSDNTRRICERYAEYYPDKIRMMPKAPNKGVVDNYFDAVEASRGRYVSDCAGDDAWVDTSLLEREIDLLDADPTLTVVFPDVVENGRNPHSKTPRYKIWMRPRVEGKEILKGVLNNTNALPYQLSAALYRKSALEEVLAADSSVVRAPQCGVEDVPMIAALASKGDAAFIPIIGYDYTVDDHQSLSNNLDASKAFRFYSRLLKFHPRMARFYGVPLTELQTHFREKFAYIVSVAAKLPRKEKKEAYSLLREIKKMWAPVKPTLKTRLRQLLRI